MSKFSFPELLQYVEDAPDDVGVVRMNHDTASCGGTSKSLSIRRFDDGHIFCKCYRCGKFGSYYPPESKYFKAKRTTHAGDDADTSTSLGVDGVNFPPDYTQDLGEWGVKEREILTRYGITGGDIKRYGVGFSPKYNRVIFPVYRDSILQAYQARSYHDDPKYITKCGDMRDLWVYFSCQSGDSSTVTVVEDFWSGIRCSRITNALVMMGSTTSDAGLVRAMEDNDKFIIFNDYDTPQIVMEANKLKELLTMMGYPVSIIAEGKDPKELTDEQLEEILL